MRILWLSHVVPYPPKGGLWQRSYNLLKQIGINNEVHLLSLNKNKLLPSQEKLFQAKDELLKICSKVDIFPITSENTLISWGLMTAISYFKNNPYDVNWLHSEDMLNFVRNLSGNNNNHYDIVHLDTFGMYPYSEFFKHSKMVLNHHNIESSMMNLRYQRESNFFKKLYFKKEADKIASYERIVCKKCDLNLVVSELDALRLKAIAGNIRVSVVPNGVDIEYFKSKNPENINSHGLIFAGGMSYYANREAVLFFVSDIFPELKKVCPDIPVTFIGRNPPRELLDIKGDTNINITGFVEDVRPYFDKSKIYICPIKNGGGTRLKIIDALAMRKPLVATGMAVEGLNLIEGVHYLRAETGEDFVNKIRLLESNDLLCKKLASNGRNFVEKNYSWDIIGQNMNEEYNNLL